MSSGYLASLREWPVYFGMRERNASAKGGCRATSALDLSHRPATVCFVHRNKGWRQWSRHVQRPLVALAIWRAKRRREFQIFLSHSEDDRQLCEELRESAGKAGVEVYLAEHDHRPGSDLASRVEAAIDKSNAVVVLVSSNSVSAPYVHQEIGYARKGGKLIVPLVQPGIQATKLAMLQGLEYIPFDFNEPFTGHARLNAALRRLIDQQVTRKRQREIAAMMGLAVVSLLASVVADEFTSQPTQETPTA